ncbi:hypothetical protein [Desulfofustis limnaeus]|jgi:hypothetical protein|uniref:Hydrolase n=1 Tax=Desulfofustis limnaeus TaxID=2740163 RepID=A0ABM7WDJ1_9BACT|nr:hypothetical protein [Desulfofustis limnaeus]MDX9894173.1 hypothetical protein [Desulfofustis sp.]BDD89043.1 hypothetical protein DPPLL_34080 [Desulfofustis limnaeus]
MIICVDFDGTIVDHRYPELGQPVPEAVVWLKRLQSCGARLILYTMRSEEGVAGNTLLPAVRYLQEQGVELYGVNHNPTQESWTSSPKVYADLYIDDSAFGCPLVRPPGFTRPCVDWKKIGPAVEHLCLSRR